MFGQKFESATRQNVALKKGQTEKDNEVIAPYKTIQEVSQKKRKMPMRYG
jgi:hypothetical protein